MPLLLRACPLSLAKEASPSDPLPAAGARRGYLYSFVSTTTTHLEHVACRVDALARAFACVVRYLRVLSGYETVITLNVSDDMYKYIYLD